RRAAPQQDGDQHDQGDQDQHQQDYYRRSAHGHLHRFVPVPGNRPADTTDLRPAVPISRQTYQTTGRFHAETEQSTRDRIRPGTGAFLRGQRGGQGGSRRLAAGPGRPVKGSEPARGSEPVRGCQRRSAAAATRSSVAVNAILTCRAPAGPENSPGPTRMPRDARCATVSQHGSSRVAHRYSDASECSMRNPCRSNASRSTARRRAYRSRCSSTCASSSSATAIAACTGAGTIIPACLRTSSSRFTSATSPVTNPARYPAMLERLDRECTASSPSWDPSHTSGWRIDTGALSASQPNSR